MQIRFFATNRDRQNLGRKVDRDTRIKLQKGGYHWVDMKKYMSYYLATTDPSEMPSEAIIENSEETVFKNFLSKDAIKRIIIGIHGFNVPFHGALTSFSVLADSLSLALKKHGSTLVTDPDKNFSGTLDNPEQDLTAFVGFSWPSDGKVLGYQSDRAEAIQTAPTLANLISYIRTHKPHTKIHILAHSMGGYVVCKMLSSLVNEISKPTYIDAEIEKQLKRQDKGGKDAYFIDRYIMLAPDVERRDVTKCYEHIDSSTIEPFIGEFYSGIEHLVQKTHVFYSRYDNALKASVMEKDLIRESLQKGKELLTGPDLQQRWESSLGLNPLPALVPYNMYSYNATALTNRAIDHGDYFDAPAIIDKIADIIFEPDQPLSSFPDIPWNFPESSDSSPLVQ